MEKESNSTWTFLNESGEIVNVDSDPGSSSESSIEFIHDDVVHYERNNNRQSSREPEVHEDVQDVTENSSEILDFDGASAANGVFMVKGDETSRSELTLENITSTNSQANVSPNSTSPVSPSSSDDSSGSVTLLEGRLSDGDSDFELLDQHSTSDLAHLQLAAGVNSASPTTQRIKFNFKFKKQVSNTTETEIVNANDADDESSNNVEHCSSTEESEVAPVVPDDEIRPVSNLGSLAPVPKHLPSPSLVFKPPRMSVTFLMLASLVLGLLLGLLTKYSLVPYSDEQLPEDIEELQRINEMNLLREENEHMRRYVDSLKGRMNTLKYSNKHQLENVLLKGRIDELDQQILAERKQILETKFTVQQPTVSDKINQHNHLTEVIQDINEPVSDNKAQSETELNAPTSDDQKPESESEMTSSYHDSPVEINNFVGVPSHDDIIQIQSSPKEQVLEGGIDVSDKYQDNTDRMLSTSGGAPGDTPQNEASIVVLDGIKSENKAEDVIDVLQAKLEEEKRRADNLEKLYTELKELVDSRTPPASDSSVSSIGPNVEIVEKEKSKKTKKSASYCLPMDKDCSGSMDLLNQDAMLQMISSVISEIPPQAQQWKEYISQKFQSMFDPQEFDEELKLEPETNSNFQLKKFNAYMNKILNQMNRAKEELHNKFAKTLNKIKKRTSKFWEKTILRNEKEKVFKKSKDRQKNKELVDIKEEKTKYTSLQDTSLQLTKENNILDIDEAKKAKMKPPKKGFDKGEKKLKKLEMKLNIDKSDDKKIKSFSAHKKKHRTSDNSKKRHPSNRKHQKHEHKFNKKQRSQKTDNEDEKHHQKSDDKEYWPMKSDNKEKKHQYKFNEDEEYWPHRFNNNEEKHEKSNEKEHWPHKSDSEGKEHWPQKSDSENQKYLHRSNGKEHSQLIKLDDEDDDDDRKHQYDDDDDDYEKHRPCKLENNKKKHRHVDDDDDEKHRPHRLESNKKKDRHDDDDDDDEKHGPYRLENHKKKHRHVDDDDDEKHGPRRLENHKKKHRHVDDDDDDEKHRPHRLENNKNKHRHVDDDDDEKHRPHRLENHKKKHRHDDDDDDDEKHRPRKLENHKKKHRHVDDDDDDDEKHRPHKLENSKNLQEEEEHDDEKEVEKHIYKSDKTMKYSSDKSHGRKKLLRKQNSLNQKQNIINKRLFNAKSISNKRDKKKAKDGRKLLEDQKDFKKHGTNRKIKVQSKESCDQLAVKLEDSIHTISKERFRRINLQTILLMSEKLSTYNTQCKHFSTKSSKEWSTCQQMWWTLCGQGFLPGQLQNLKCQRYLLAWQISAAASPDGGGKPGCDDCGCRKRVVMDSMDQSNKDQSNATDSDSTFQNEQKDTVSGEWYFKPKTVEEEKDPMSGEWYFKPKTIKEEKDTMSGEWYFKPKTVEEEKDTMSGEWYFKPKTIKEEKDTMSGEWYFKPKSVPTENGEEDHNENEFEPLSSANLWDELKNHRWQHLGKILEAKFHHLSHHKHRRHCRGYNNYYNRCYSWFNQMYKHGWTSLYWQNFMNFLENWQK